jgi:DNA repair exonuclease SbcCD ATPase subunit
VANPQRYGLIVRIVIVGATFPKTGKDARLAEKRGYSTNRTISFVHRRKNPRKFPGGHFRSVLISRGFHKVSFKITAENFQAWDKFELEASDLTVVIGPSNEGKSSIIRATRGVMRNETGAHHVKVDAKDPLSVALEMNGKTFTVKRTSKGTVSYEIEGEEKPYTSLNGDLPDPMKSLGLGEITIGDVSLDPIFARQGDPQFILAEKPQPLNVILNAFSNTEKLEYGKRNANDAIKVLNSEAKVKAKDLQSAEALRAELDVLSEKAEKQQKTLTEVMAEIDHQEALISALRTLSAALERQEIVQNTLSRLLVPSLREATVDLAVIEQLTTLMVASTMLAHQQHAIAVMNKVPRLSPIETQYQIAAELSGLIPALQRSEIHTKWLAAVSQTVNTWSEVARLYKLTQAIRAVETAQNNGVEPTRQCAEAIASRLSDISKVQQQIVQQEAVTNVLHQLIPSLFRRSVLTKELEGLNAPLQLARKTETETQQQIDTLRELETIEKQSVDCPACGHHFRNSKGENHEHTHTHAVAN